MQVNKENLQQIKTTKIYTSTNQTNTQNKTTYMYKKQLQYNHSNRKLKEVIIIHIIQIMQDIVNLLLLMKDQKLVQK